eukprot:CAMPEP_0117050396 /NCGR_PEP_ID=MMETSP0472-20121206/34791_1 /TAXON_ID=693140 ORGANISM="Tiarina fusus, Strain LIS" /NCGR_SAMPLE_ID=MMETSP0472 /ASSEMBLY_ACC=CAM_ASM_000603 /LENGTH=289 /DNA_ID=CAMNT_0004764153 /DNA_START=25 /DNA_END=894 /DNA_ORIENTATION=+
MGTTQSSAIQLGPLIPIQGILSNDKAAMESLRQSLTERSYALFSLTEPEIINSFHGITNDIHQFFNNTQPQKDKLISEEGNVGYVRTSTREFLKLRNCDIPNCTENMNEFNMETATNALSNLERIGWHCFTGMNEISPNPLPEVELSDLKECLEERASLSVIHYFPAEVSEASEYIREMPNADDRCGNANSALEVCSQHKDTGIFTLIMTSSVPGLEVYDNTLKAWIPLERLVQEFRNTPSKEVMVLLMGHKAPLFLGNQFQPTLHRVTVPQGVERPSFLYFMDTAKIN